MVKAMQLPNLIRYGLSCGIAATAEANRRDYAMTTTWLPHQLTNSLTLLLPELYRLLGPDEQAPVKASPRVPPKQPVWAEARRVLCDTLTTMVRDNPGYVVYVAPLAAGYLLSHPHFNIYKGELGEKEFLGFGLDTLPHSATAFALTALTCDTAQAAIDAAPPDGPLADLLAWCAAHPARFSAVVLALATLAWEVGEYNIHRHELAQRGDARAINMQWSVRDTIYDCAANLIGWGVALAWRRTTARAADERQHTRYLSPHTHTPGYPK